MASAHGWYADLMTRKCHRTPTHPAACELEAAASNPTMPGGGGEQHGPAGPSRPQLLRHLPARRLPPTAAPGPRGSGVGYGGVELALGDRAPSPSLPVLGSYTSPSFTSTLLKRTTPPSLGKGFWVSPAEKDTREGTGTPGVRGHGAFTGVRGQRSGPGARRPVPGRTGSLTVRCCLKVVKHRETPSPHAGTTRTSGGRGAGRLSAGARMRWGTRVRPHARAKSGVTWCVWGAVGLGWARPPGRKPAREPLGKRRSWLLLYEGKSWSQA